MTIVRMAIRLAVYQTLVAAMVALVDEVMLTRLSPFIATVVCLAVMMRLLHEETEGM